MIKKKYFLLLSMLLLIVLLGFSGSCYARTLTEEECENFILNAYIFRNSEEPTSEFISQVRAVDFSSWVQASETYEGQWYITNYTGYAVDFGYYTGSTTNLGLYGPYKPSNNSTISVNTSYLTRKRSRFGSNNEFSLSEFGNYNVNIGSSPYFLYTDSNVYNTGTISGATTIFNAGYMTHSNIFDYNFTPAPTSYFTIDINADFRDDKATISNDTSGTEYYLIPYTANKIRIGNMFDYSNLAAVIKRKFRYKQSIRSFELVQEYQANTNNLDFFDIAEDNLIVFEYYQPESTEFITFIPKDGTGFNEFTVAIYYTTDNTRIVNGVIDNGDTFSGDYYHDYNNDTNTEKIIDNTNDDSQVDTILNNFTSGDLLNAGGYVERENPFRTFILAFVYDVCDILLNPNQEDVYFDYSMHGETPTRIYASSFTTPETPLKVFIRLSMIFGSLFVVYIQFKEVIDLISTGNAAKVLHLGDADVYFYKM